MSTAASVCRCARLCSPILAVCAHACLPLVTNSPPPSPVNLTPRAAGPAGGAPGSARFDVTGCNAGSLKLQSVKVAYDAIKAATNPARKKGAAGRKLALNITTVAGGVAAPLNAACTNIQVTAPKTPWKSTAVVKCPGCIK